MDIKQGKIIVTGAASGMGKHFVRRFAELGAQVAAVDLNQKALEDLAHSEWKGLSVYPLVCDVSKEDQVIEMVAKAYDAMGGLNGLVNNAGIFRDALLVKKDRKTQALKKMSLEQWQAVINVDLTGPFLCTREFVAKLLETDTKPGVVVSISSVSRHGNAGQSNYSAAKAGLVADTKLWSQEFARYGIRFGAVAPGFIRTPILEGMRPEILEKTIQRVPLRRLGEPEEIFMGVKFIFECDYFTGRCLDIDGGLVL